MALCPSPCPLSWTEGTRFLGHLGQSLTPSELDGVAVVPGSCVGDECLSCRPSSCAFAQRPVLFLAGGPGARVLGCLPAGAAVPV